MATGLSSPETIGASRTWTRDSSGVGERFVAGAAVVGGGLVGTVVLPDRFAAELLHAARMTTAAVTNVLRTRRG
jgi:hypothetical protein